MKDDFQFMLITLILNLKMIMLDGSAVMENDKRKIEERRNILPALRTSTMDEKSILGFMRMSKRDIDHHQKSISSP